VKRILVLQLFRFGDILQTTPALSALRRAHPDAEISVLVRRRFAEAVRGNPDVDDVIQWNPGPEYDRLIAGARINARAAGALRAFLSPLRAARFDLVCNFSNDLPSALITYLLRGKQVMGLAFCRDRTYRVRNNWMRYLFVTNEARRLNSVNLADCLSMACAGVPAGRPVLAIAPRDRGAADVLLRESFEDLSRPIVAIQAGASKDYKRWPAENFAALGARLIAEGCDVLLLGSKEEQSRNGGILSRMPGSRGHAADAAGKTSFAELGAVLERCRLLVSNDTATIHAAAAVGCTSLTLAFGPTGAFETAPLGEGNLVLTPAADCYPCDWNGLCPDVPCRDRLTPDMVYAAATCALNDGVVPEGPARSSGVVLYRTKSMPDGLLGLRPLNRPPLSLKEALRLAYRAYTLRHWTGLEPSVSRSELPAWIGDALENYACEDPHALQEALRAAVGDFRTLAELARLGMRAADVFVTARVGSGNPSHERLVAALGRLEERIHAFENSPVAGVLAAAFRHNIRDMDPAPLRQQAVAHRWNYFNLANGCDRMAGSLERLSAALAPPEAAPFPSAGAALAGSPKAMGDS